MQNHQVKPRLLFFSCLALSLLVSSDSFAESNKEPLKIVSLEYKGKCASKLGIMIVTLNKKITRAMNRVAIAGGKDTHFHPRIVKWGFRSNTIQIQVPGGPTLRKGKRYGVMIEGRLPHKRKSNRSPFKVCWR